MRSAATRPQFNQFASRQTPDTLLDELAEWDLLQARAELRSSIRRAWGQRIRCTRFVPSSMPFPYVFQAVRFLTDAFDLFDLDVPSCQEPDSLFVAWDSKMNQHILIPGEIHIRRLCPRCLDSDRISSIRSDLSLNAKPSPLYWSIHSLSSHSGVRHRMV